MEIKPRYNNTGTIKININPVQRNIKSKVIRDPSGLIPNSVYKVIRWERSLIKFNLLLSMALTLAMVILITLYATVYKVGWIGYVLPLIGLLAGSWKLMFTIQDKIRLDKEINYYKEDLKIGLTTQPPFIVRIYRSTNMKQVYHNWLTFFLLFNGSILTLLLWWLKDVSWWIFDFEKWVKNLFWNPTLMTTLFTISLFVIGVLHVVFAIQRKKRLIEIDSYFGHSVIPHSEINELRKDKNKMLRRLFILYVMIVLIIPMIIKLILRVVAGRRK